MKILVLCDRNSAAIKGFALRAQMETTLKQAGHAVQTVVLNQDEMKPCLGCFGCWVKTPGLCIITDDCVTEISRIQVQSDAVVILSEIVYGGFSPDIKAFLDRDIPNISPSFAIYHGQMHHKMRYERFPDWIVLGYGDSTEEEREIFQALAGRNALNLRPPRHFCFTMQSADDCREAVMRLGRIFAGEVRE